MGKVIGVISIKGGVGKTTVSSTLASSLANNFGKRVLLIDANYSAPNLGIHMDILNPDKTIHDVLAGDMRMKEAITSKFGVDVIAGSYSNDKEINFLRLRDKVNTVKDEYDFVVIDSSPSLNEEVLSCMLASDNLFVVTTPDYPTMSCSLKAAKLAKQRGKNISGIIINKIRNPRYELNLKEIEETIGIPVVACIKDDLNVGKALFNRLPVNLQNKRGNFSKEIQRLSCALMGIKEKRGITSLLFGTNFNKEVVNRQLLRKDFYTNTFQ